MSKADVYERQQSVCPRTELEFLIQASQAAMYGGHPAPGIAALHVCGLLQVGSIFQDLDRFNAFANGAPFLCHIAHEHAFVLPAW